MKGCLRASNIALLLIFAIPVHGHANFAIQVGSFSSEKNASNLIERLSSEGFSCAAHNAGGVIRVMCDEFSSRDDAIALKNELEGNVFSGFLPSTVMPVAPSITEMPSTQPSAPPVSIALAADIAVEGAPLESPLQDEAEEVDSTEAADDIATKKIVATPPEDDTLADDTSMTEEIKAREAEPEPEGNINGDIIEEGKNYIHPFLSIAVMYTDNLFNLKEDRESDSGYIFSPGVKVSFPASHSAVTQPPLSVGAVGGRSYSTMSDPVRRHLLGALYYRGDVEEYNKNDEQDSVSHTGNVLLAYDSMNWVFADVSAQYLRSHEERSYLGLGKRGVYEGRRTSGQVTLGPDKKASLNMEYTVFDLSYENDDDRYRERSDRSYNGQISLLLKPKTRIFVGYQQNEIEYKKKEYVPGSTVKSYFAGVMWDFASKTRGVIRAGQSVKEFDDDFDKYNTYTYDLDDRKTSIVEAQIQYTPSPKSKINFTGLKAWKETDMVESAYIHSYSVSISFSHRLTAKLSSNLQVLYQEDTYEGDVVIGTQSNERVDRVYSITVAFQHKMSRFHSVGLEYNYKKRDSNFDAIDYYTNTYFLRLTSSL